MTTFCSEDGAWERSDEHLYTDKPEDHQQPLFDFNFDVHQEEACEADLDDSQDGHGYGDLDVSASLSLPHSQAYDGRISPGFALEDYRDPLVAEVPVSDATDGRITPGFALEDPTTSPPSMLPDLLATSSQELDDEHEDDAGVLDISKYRQQLYQENKGEPDLDEPSLSPRAPSSAGGSSVYELDLDEELGCDVDFSSLLLSGDSVFEKASPASSVSCGLEFHKDTLIGTWNGQLIEKASSRRDSGSAQAESVSMPESAATLAEKELSSTSSSETSFLKNGRRLVEIEPRPICSPDETSPAMEGQPTGEFGAACYAGSADNAVQTADRQAADEPGESFHADAQDGQAADELGASLYAGSLDSTFEIADVQTAAGAQDHSVPPLSPQAAAELLQVQALWQASASATQTSDELLQVQALWQSSASACSASAVQTSDELVQVQVPLASASEASASAGSLDGNYHSVDGQATHELGAPGYAGSLNDISESVRGQATDELGGPCCAGSVESVERQVVDAPVISGTEALVERLATVEASRPQLEAMAQALLRRMEALDPDSAMAGPELLTERLATVEASRPELEATAQALLRRMEALEPDMTSAMEAKMPQCSDPEMASSFADVSTAPTVMEASMSLMTTDTDVSWLTAGNPGSLPDGGLQETESQRAQLEDMAAHMVQRLDAVEKTL